MNINSVYIYTRLRTLALFQETLSIQRITYAVCGIRHITLYWVFFCQSACSFRCNWLLLLNCLRKMRKICLQHVWLIRYSDFECKYCLAFCISNTYLFEHTEYTLCLATRYFVAHAYWQSLEAILVISLSNWTCLHVIFFIFVYVLFDIYSGLSLLAFL